MESKDSDKRPDDASDAPGGERGEPTHPRDPATRPARRERTQPRDPATRPDFTDGERTSSDE
jgi:hypothetical protein